MGMPRTPTARVTALRRHSYAAKPLISGRASHVTKLKPSRLPVYKDSFVKSRSNLVGLTWPTKPSSKTIDITHEKPKKPIFIWKDPSEENPIFIHEDTSTENPIHIQEDSSLDEDLLELGPLDKECYKMLEYEVEEAAVIGPNRVDKTQHVRNVLAAILNNKFLVWTFLLELFESGDTKLNTIANLFYGRQGPATILNSWDNRIVKRKHRVSLQDAAAGLVSKRVNDEFRRLTESGRLRCNMTKITPATVDQFSLNGNFKVFEMYTPTFLKILKGISTDSTFDNSDVLPKEKKCVIPTVCNMLAYHRSQQTNGLQIMMGLYLDSIGAPCKAIDLLCKAGLSVCYTTTSHDSFRFKKQHQQYF
ncbi:hypothetical protein BGZ76_004610 [Entomortierella beljakovae]|nr:hypothetical protein BGZ76_004610 [Entomortierella beljakovae]